MARAVKWLTNVAMPSISKIGNFAQKALTISRNFVVIEASTIWHDRSGVKAEMSGAANKLRRYKGRERLEKLTKLICVTTQK